MSNNEINRVPELIPQDIANSSAGFVQFLKKYYEFLNQDGMPSDEVSRALHKRNLDLAIDNYLDVLYLEFGYGYVFNRDANKANILSNLSELYSAKGSLDSIKVLFRIIFGEEVNIRLPKDVILQPSHGNWLSEYSVMGELVQGNPYDMIGKFIEVETQFADTPVQTFDVEVKRVELRDEELQIYQIYTSRYFAGFFAESSVLKYGDVELTLKKSMNETVAGGIEEAGSGFRVGEVYQVKSYDRGNAYNDLIGIPSNLSRKSPSQSKFRRIDVENVDIDVRSDGTLTEVITKETDRGTIKISNIIRGSRKVSRVEYADGTVQETVETIDALPAPNLQVDWDAIAEALTELADLGFDTDSKKIYDVLIADSGDGTSWADANGDSRVSSFDALNFMKHFHGYSISSAIQTKIDNFYAAYETEHSEVLAPTLLTATIVLQLAVNLSEEDITSEFLPDVIDVITEELSTSGYIRGDIDNDGTIDTTDLNFFIQYSDDTQRELMNQVARTWIDTYVVSKLNTDNPSYHDPNVGTIEWNDLTDQEKYEYISLGYLNTYTQGVRNQLHDFLLQEDVDYDGFVRGDITNDGSITMEDVKLLLRRASGVDVASGSIKDLNYSELVGGYQSISIEAVPATNAGGQGAVIEPAINNGVLTNLDIYTPGIGLTSATVTISDRSNNFNSYSTAKVDIRDGRIRDVDMLSIGSNYSENSTIVDVAYSQIDARVYPIISGGVITGFNIVEPGTGYTNLSDIVVTGTGSGLIADVVTKDGVIVDLELVNGGAGYSNDVTVTVNSTTGTGADVDAIIESGVITGFVINDGGDGYNFADDESTNIGNNTVTIIDNVNTPTEEAQVSRVYTTDGLIADFNIYDGGSGYSNRFNCYIDRVTQVPELRPIIQDGVVTSVNVSNGGYGYKEDTTNLVVTAERIPTVLSYELDGSGSFTSIEVVSGEDGYDITSNLIIQDDDGSGLLADVFVTNGKVTSIVIIDGGSGYTDPTLSLDARKEIDISVDVDTDYLTWIDEVIVEPLIGSEYNPILLEGAGKGAEIRIQEVTGNGGITRVKLQTFGYNYPDFFNTFIEPRNQGGTVANLGFKSTVVGVTEPSYVDRKGFLSDIIKVQDNNFYQQFSYVIETGVPIELFNEIVIKSVHPAGMKVFGEQTITDRFDLEASIIEGYAAFQNRLFLDVTDHSDNDDWHLYKESDSTKDTAVTLEDRSTLLADILKPKQDFTDVQSNTDDVWYFEKDLTVEDYHEYSTPISNKETYHMFKESDSTTEENFATHNKETWVMLKSLLDTAITSDDTTIADDDIFAMTKVLSDGNYAISNKETWVLEKPFTDTATSTHNKETWVLGKPLSDTATSTHNKETWTMSKVKYDSGVTSETVGKYVRKPLEDTVEDVSDAVIVAIGLNVYVRDGNDEIIANADHTLVTSENVGKYVRKPLFDVAVAEDDTAIANADDDNIYSINKYRTDLADAQDEGGSLIHNIIYATDYFEDPQDYANQNINYTF